MSLRTTTSPVLGHSLDQLKLLIAMKYVDDVIIVDKFGQNSSVGTSEEDLWNGPADEETLLTTGATMYASCTDNVNGVGQVIFVNGLDENWNIQNGKVTLTGQTQAEVVGTDGSTGLLWTRVHRAFQISASPDPVGDVYIAQSDTLTGGVPDTPSLVHAYVPFTNAAQQTQKAIYTIPRDHFGLIYEVQGYMAQSTGTARYVTLRLETASLALGATPDNPSWAPRRAREEYSVSTSDPSFEHKLFGPIVVNELTNVHLRAVASTTSSVFGSFELIVLPNVYGPTLVPTLENIID